MKNNYKHNEFQEQTIAKINRICVTISLLGTCKIKQR